MSGKKIKFLIGVKISLFCLCLLPSNSVWAKECSSSTINAQIKKLNKTADWVFTVAALRKCGTPAVAALAADLQAQDEQVRINAASALASMGVEAQPATDALAYSLKDSSSIVRSSAATALGSMGTKAKKAIPALSVALQDDDKSVRSVVATALGSMGVEAESAIPALTSVLQDKDKSVSSTAAYALGRIAADFQYRANSLSSSELEKIISELEKAVKAIEKPNSNTETTLLIQSLKMLKAEQDERWLERTFIWMVQHPIVAIALAYLLFIILLWSLILRLRPVWILHINNVLKARITLPGLGKYEIPIRSLLGVSFLEHHPRVLDAWMKTQFTAVQQTSEKRERIRLLYNSTLRKIPQFEQRTVQKYAKAIAWECMKQTYQPTSVKRDKVVAAITVIGGRNAAEEYLQFLELHLGIIQKVGKAQDSIRFNHELLAEYLASLYLVELYGNDQENWRKFLAQVDAIPNKQAIRGFLLTVRDCSLALQASANIPNFVPEEIGKRVGVVTKRTGLQAV